MVSLDLEFITERLVIEEDPRIAVLPIPLELQLSHTLHQSWQLGISYQTDKCSLWLSRMVTEQWYGLQQSLTGVFGVLVIRVSFQPICRTRRMCLRYSRLRIRSKELVRICHRLLDSDVNDTTAPGRRVRDAPDEKSQ